MRLIFFIYISLLASLYLSCFGQNPGEPIKLSKAVNSPFAERVPLISLDGKALYFARKSHPQNMGSDDKDDIWVSYLNPKTKEWTKAVNVGTPLNNDGHNFVVSINTSGDAMYLANDYNNNLKDAISYTIKKGRRWSTPHTIDIPDYKNKSPYVSYYVSKDEKYLLISAEQNDTEGGRDFYVCFKTNTGWTSPLNLGKDINSKGEENSIFLAADNKTVYFSSDGQGGMGGYDLFVSKRLDDSWTRWSNPENLGPKINTPSNDLSISIPASGDYAYLARGPIEDTDIYKIKIPEAYRPSPVAFIQAQLVDSETRKPIDGRIFFESLDKDRDDEKSIRNAQSATYIVETDENMGIYAEVKGYFPVSAYYSNDTDDLEAIDSDSDAYYSNPELQTLQNRLDDLQREIKSLQIKKSGTKNKKRKSSSAKVKSTKKSIDNKSKSFKNVGDEEDELGELKSKYQQYLEGSDAPAVKNEVEAKASDSDALKAAREKYRAYYSEEENSEATSTKTYTSEDLNLFAQSTIEKLFSEFYLPVVRSVKKAEGINLSTKDVARLEVIIKADLMAVWTPKVLYRLKTEYANQADRETRLSIKKDIKDEFADALRTDVDLHIIMQKEKNLKANISKQLDAPSKKNTTKSKIEDEEIKVTGYQEVEKKLSLIPLKEGAVFPLNNIFFDVNMAKIKPQSESELNRVFLFLQSNPKLSIEIGGHTNGWCSAEFALDLSSDRSEAVYQYLMDKGIKKNRLTFKGYGKSDPIATNKTQAGRRQNQRVELKILNIIE